jgi:signal transduction histidine kinase
MERHAADALSIAIGVLELSFVVLVGRRLVRFGRTFPWLLALVAFFLARGVDRLYAGVSGNGTLGWTVDVVVLAALVLLIAGMQKTVDALAGAQDEATLRSEEYARALRDYRLLVRHRLANPIATIKGSLATLRDVPDLDEATRRELLDAADAEAERLERLALEPEIATPEEAELQPRPDVDLARDAPAPNG